ncbi:MAG: hypothetical protein M3161_04765 [Actinomycetota bacterium]|nr:hypothetical protein [Actinomycetota bacterium]
MRRSLRKTFVGLVAVGALVGASLGTTALAEERQEGVGEGLELVKNLDTGTGTDFEVAKINGREYAFATSRAPIAEGGGINVIDVTNPAKAKVVHTVPCAVSQGDIQISHDKKTLMVGLSAAGAPDSCGALGKRGMLTIDITNPLKAKPIGFVETMSSHNLTAHPKKPIVWNSIGAAAAVPGVIEIMTIKNPAKPKVVATASSLPHAPHDVSFSEDGKYAVTAAVDHFDIFDTTDPVNPQLLYKGQCPGCTITHDAKFTPDGKTILIGDEGGGGLPYPCPGGAFYFYDFSNPPVPVLTGVYWPAEVVTAQGSTSPGACTSHVFDVNSDGTKISISWYTVGTRYLDISGAVGATVGSYGTPTGIIECGWYIPENGDSWASKFSLDDRWIFSNDINRGFDIYKITAEC